MGIVTGPMFVPTQRHDTYPAIDPSKADLSGKVVLITGASKGIGKAAAISLAQAGVRGLVLLARSDLTPAKEAALSHKRPGRPLDVLAIPVDVANNAQVVSAVKQVEETFGRLDVVINNAGYIETSNFVADSDPEDWWTAWNVNMRGTYHVSRAVLPLLIKCGGDRTIINVSSSTSSIFVPGSSAYSVGALPRTPLITETYFCLDIEARAVTLCRVDRRRIRRQGHTGLLHPPGCTCNRIDLDRAARIPAPAL